MKKVKHYGVVSYGGYTEQAKYIFPSRDSAKKFMKRYGGVWLGKVKVD